MNNFKDMLNMPRETWEGFGKARDVVLTGLLAVNVAFLAASVSLEKLQSGAEEFTVFFFGVAIPILGWSIVISRMKGSHLPNMLIIMMTFGAVASLCGLFFALFRLSTFVGIASLISFFLGFFVFIWHSDKSKAVPSSQKSQSSD